MRIRSEFAVDRYFGEPSGSERVFRDAWFQPGDLATLDDEGLLVITGRDAPQRLIDAADLVTEMAKVKHPMDAGRKGQRGIEW